MQRFMEPIAIRSVLFSLGLRAFLSLTFVYATGSISYRLFPHIDFKMSEPFTVNLSPTLLEKCIVESYHLPRRVGRRYVQGLDDIPDPRSIIFLQAFLVKHANGRCLVEGLQARATLCRIYNSYVAQHKI